MSNYSPLRYPGGKGKLSTFIQSIIEENDLLDCTYVEPFCGGSAVALSLLFEGYAKKIIINDYDPVIYSFWHSVINDTENFIKKIWDSKLSIKLWETAKLIHKNQSDHLILEIGFATFLLNRVNRSGILKAGIIGGKSQSGPWKMNARYNKIELIERIERIALQKNRIEVTNMDAVNCLQEIQKRQLVKVFSYLDPPYYHKGPELYLNFFSHEDHVRISQFIKKMKLSHWLISYDNCDEISKLYSFLPSTSYELNYSAGKTRNKGKEILLTSKGLILPTTLSGIPLTESKIASNKRA